MIRPDRSGVGRILYFTESFFRSLLVQPGSDTFAYHVCHEVVHKVYELNFLSVHVTFGPDAAANETDAILSVVVVG